MTVEMEELLPNCGPPPIKRVREGQEKSKDNRYIHTDPMFRIIFQRSRPTQPSIDSQTDGLYGVNRSSE